MRLANYVSLADLGCPCKNHMGDVTCGGYCGERVWDDPDRLRYVNSPTVGQPVTPAINVNPSTDQGPQNNDWAVDGNADSVDLGMGDAMDAFSALPTISKIGLGVAIAGLFYLSFGKNGALKKWI